MRSNPENGWLPLWGPFLSFESFPYNTFPEVKD
jgi:hypothetical protein